MLQLLVIGFYILATIYVMKKAPPSRQKRIFTLLLLSLALWLLSSFAIDKGWSTETVIALLKIDFIIAEFIAFFILLFSLSLVIKQQRMRLATLILLICPIILGGAIVFSDQLITHLTITAVETFFTTSDVTVKFGSLHAPYSFTICGYTVIALLVLFVKYLRSTGIPKTQIGFILVGFTLSFLVTSTHAFILPYVERQSTATAHLSQYASIIFVLSTAYAMTRYRFLGIKVIINARKKKYDLSNIATSIERAVAGKQEIQAMSALFQKELMRTLNTERVEIVSHYTPQSSLSNVLEHIDAFTSRNDLVITQELPFTNGNSPSIEKLYKLLRNEHIGIIIPIPDHPQTAIVIYEKTNDHIFTKTELDALEAVASRIITAVRHILLFQQSKDRIEHANFENQQRPA